MAIDFVTGVIVTGAQKRDLDGVGMFFTNTTGTEITITELGRWVISTNSGTHAIGIYESSTFASPAATVTVDTVGAPAEQFLYGTLPSPYVVAIGATIRIISTEVSGGDYWYGNLGAGPSNILTVTDIGSTASAYVSNTTGLITNGGNVGGTYTAIGPVAFRYTAPEPGWTKDGTVYTVGSATPVYSTNSAIRDASDGDTILMPTATFVFGGSYGRIVINKDVDVIGAGEGNTVMNLSNSTPNYESGSGIVISAGGTFSHATINNSQGIDTSDRPTAIIASTTRDWRIHHVTYNSSTYVGYFISATSYGLYDHCTINGGAGNDEWVFIKVPTDSWTTPSSLGTADAVYGEDNNYNVQGYTDLNSGARGVVRFSTISPTTGNYVKMDGHGYYSNANPRQGVRHQEFYNLNWTASFGSNLGFEIRGGGGRIFNNSAAVAPAFYLRDYGYTGNTGNWGSVYQTPLNYPLFNQIGTGQWVEIDVEDLVAYQRCQISFIGDTVWTAIGGPATPSTNGSSSNSQFTATGPGTGTGRVYICPATEPMYLWGNIKNTGTTPAAWTRTPQAVAGGAVTLYRAQTGNPVATFTETDIIQANRDFFASAGFDAMATGVTVGLFADRGTAVGKTGQGYWATDMGTWNTQNDQVGTPGYQQGQGQLYVSDGADWVLDYEPYTYPHPLQGTFPTQASAAINAAGNTLTIVWSEAVENGTGGGDGIALSASGGAVTAAYSSGSGTDTYVYDLTGRIIQSGETITDAYTQPGDGIKSVATGLEVASFSGGAVSNASSISGGMASGLRAFASLGAGF